MISIFFNFSCFICNAAHPKGNPEVIEIAGKKYTNAINL